MSKELLTTINVTLDLYSVIVGIIIFISIILRKTIGEKVRIWFEAVVMCNVLMAASDIFTWLFEGTANPANRIILPIATFIFYIMSFAVIINSGYYLLNFVDKNKFKKFLKIVFLVVAVIYLLLIIITPCTGVLY